jgi:pyruvate/2-oxoglutarate dehydrogenase complex dihydrolipoamide dehydrogenase (E3) component
VSTQEFDLVIIGAGSGGLTAAGFASRLGVKVALIEKSRIGGDCTWTGCVPSKALLKAAKIAHEARSAENFGISVTHPITDMNKVRDFVRSAIARVYKFESPVELEKQGICIIMGEARFVDAHMLAVGETTIRSEHFLITTGAHPALPSIAGIENVPYVTYEHIFENDRLPPRLIVVGGGPVGVEIAQAYQRLGSQVTIVASSLLPKEEPEARTCIEKILAQEGLILARGRARSVRKDADEIIIATDSGEFRGDMFLMASGRRPNVDLDLEKAGIKYSAEGIPVDDQLRTNVKHIFAAGDVVGGYQFTHFAGWQAFQAVRNALLPGHSSGFTDVVPWVTFTDPEVAHVGLTEEEARAKHGADIQVRRWEMSHTDRAVCESDEEGFIKVVASADGTILGATMVAGRAGEAITEFIVAIKNKFKFADIAGAIHAYPTYSTAVQQLAADATIEKLLSGASGKILKNLSKIIR